MHILCYRAVRSFMPRTLSAALAFAETGDLIVITPTDVAAAWEQVTQFKPAGLRGAARSPLLAAE